MGYQSAFIRITFQPDCSSPKPPPEKNLIIPLEVEVSDVPGIYASTPLLDFGIFRQSEESSHLSLSIINSGKKARDVEINWIRQTPIKGKQITLSGLWVFNVGNMQAIKSGFYLLHVISFEIKQYIWSTYSSRFD